MSLFRVNHPKKSAWPALIFGLILGVGLGSGGQCATLNLTPGLPFDWTLVQPGDTVQVAPGVYTNEVIDIQTSGLPGQPVVIDGTGVTMLNGWVSASQDTQFGPGSIRRDHLVIQGFRIEIPAKVGGMGRAAIWYGGPPSAPQIDLVIKDCELIGGGFFTTVFQAGILESSNTGTIQGLTVRRCRIYNWASNAIHIGFDSRDFLIEDNFLADIWGFEPVHSEHIAVFGRPTNVTIRRNLFTQQPGSLGIAISVYEDVRNLDIGNNVFVDINSPVTFHPAGTIGPTSFINNTLYNCGNIVVYQSQIGRDIYSLNNAFVNSTFRPWGLINVPASSGFGEGSSLLVIDSNNLYSLPEHTSGQLALVETNPLLNPSGFDFRLNPNSLAIDTGINTGARFAVDFYGKSRPLVPGWDRGASEFDPLQGPPPTPEPTVTPPPTPTPTPIPTPLPTPIPGEGGDDPWLVLGGNKFFPLFVWQQRPGDVSFYSALGFNSFMGNGWASDTDTQLLDNLQASGMAGILPFNPDVLGHPALLAWMFGDEPDLTGISNEQIRDQYSQIRAVSPLPVVVNTGGSFYADENFDTYPSGFLSLFGDRPGTSAYFSELFSIPEIVSFDFYPVTGWNNPSYMYIPGAATKQLSTIFTDGTKPRWAILEASDQDLAWTPPETRGPTPEELRFQTWHSIINGATGIGYFTIAFNPFRYMNFGAGIEAELLRTNTQITALADVILSTPSPIQIVASDDLGGNASNIDFTVRNDGDTYYVFAVNKNIAPGTSTISFTFDSDILSASIYDEPGPVGFSGPTLTEVFGPLDVRIFVISFTTAPTVVTPTPTPTPIPIEPTTWINVDGEPYFPLFVTEPASNPLFVPQFSDLGLNTVIGNTGGPSTDGAMLDILESRGMMGILEFNDSVKDDPALLAWTFGFMPDIEGTTASGFQFTKNDISSLDPNHPVVVELSPGFYLDANFDDIPPALGGSRSHYYAYMATTDIACFGISPITELGDPDLIYLPGSATGTLRTVYGNNDRPVWTIIEATLSNSAGGAASARAPSAQEVHHEIWDAIISGSTGIGYSVTQLQPFSFIELSAAVEAEIKRSNAWITDLTDVILSAPSNLPVSVTESSGASFKYMVRERDGVFYIFVINTALTSLSENITVTFNEPIPPVGVYGEARGIMPNGDQRSFSDPIEPLGVRIFTADLGSYRTRMNAAGSWTLYDLD